MRPGERKTCEACGLEMVGVAHVRTGKVAPIVVEPSERGNCLAWRDPVDGRPRYAVVASPDVRAYLANLEVPLRLNHFAELPIGGPLSSNGGLTWPGR